MCRAVSCVQHTKKSSAQLSRAVLHASWLRCLQNEGLISVEEASCYLPEISRRLGSGYPKYEKYLLTQDHKKCKTWKHISKLIKVDSGAYVHIIIFVASLFFDRWLDHALYLYYFLKIASNIHMHIFFLLGIFPSDSFMEKDHFQLTCCTNFTLWHILPD